MDRASHGSRGHLTRRVQLGIAFGFSLFTTYLLLQPGATNAESTPFGDFRGYFSFDQLTYAAIASNAAGGNLAMVEPFTETGSSFYPSLWYLFMGVVAGVAGVGVPAVWTLLGAIAVALSVVAVGFVAYRLSGRSWAPALVGPALWIGPLALVFGESWYLPLESHALLWGPYGQLFSLNAEAVGTSAGVIALMMLLLASMRSPRSPGSVALVGAAGLVVGLLANIHTYSFLVTVGFVATWIAVVGIGSAAPSNRLPLAGLSVAVVVTVGVIGSISSPLRESLAMFMLMLLAAVPGGLIVVRRVPKLAIVGLAAVVITSAPQVLLVLTGIASGDPFLAYRQVQSGSLDIGLVPFLLATLPIGLWVLVISLASKRSSLPLPIKASVGSGFLALTILSFNNVWGFVQEPYRMWIASLTLTTMLAVPLTAYVIANREIITDRSVVRITAAAAVAAVALSWWNVGGFRAYLNDLTPISFGSSRLTALSDLTTGRGGLFTSDPCIDPLQLKVASRERVAFYSRGLAWPDGRESIDAVIDSRSAGVFDPEILRRAGVTYLVTDSTCPAAWESRVDGDLVLAGEAPYGAEESAGVLRLWLVQ